MKLTKPRIILAAVLVIAGGTAAYRYFKSPSRLPFDLARAELRNVTQEVTETGNVKPVKSVDLAFETSGGVSGVYANVGDAVSAGQSLASLDNTELKTSLAKAQADLQTQQSQLDKANVDLNNYYASIPDIANSAYTNANNAVRIQTDILFTNPETNPKIIFTPLNSQNEIDAENQRLILTQTLNNWLKEVGGLNQNIQTAALEQSLGNAQNNLMNIRSYLDLLAIAVTHSSLPQTSINTYQADINTARTGINASLSSANSLAQEIGAQKALIAADQDSLKSYQASIENIKAQIQKTVLYSPINGVVTRQDAKVGEIAAANASIVSVISASNFEIWSYIPEVDIARVKVGDKANVTLDAYGNSAVFDAAVSSIDPGETEIEGVATYLTKLQFQKYDPRIKSGMTANIDIVSGSRGNTLAVPQRAVTEKDGKKLVTVYDEKTKQTADREVITGLKSYDGYVEILNGLKEGDEVVIPRATQ